MPSTRRISIKEAATLKTLTLLLIICVAVISAPVMAGRIVSTPITHDFQVYQAYPGTSSPRLTDRVTDAAYLGYTGGPMGNAGGANNITAVPGVLQIVPGCMNWCNYVSASQAGVPYTIKNVTLVKTTPSYTQCSIGADNTPIFPPHTVTQQGTPNIRVWWPLMYELPSTTFTLTILYGTPTLYDDDGNLGPNPPAWVHVEQWTWHVNADFESLHNLIDLFHELPYGKDEVPLISDEILVGQLRLKVDAAAAAYTACDLAGAAMILTDFELEVMDACIGTSPAFPNPTGPGTGIANSNENPACCKLLIDVEYILQTTGIGQQKK